MPGRRGRPPHPDVLTPAEHRVLDELRDGGTNAEIAVRLGLSPETVKYHVANMLAKLDLRDRGELAAWRPRRARGLAVIPAFLLSLRRPLLVAGGVATAIVVGMAALLVLTLADGDDERELGASGWITLLIRRRRGPPTRRSSRSLTLRCPTIDYWAA